MSEPPPWPEPFRPVAPWLEEDVALVLGSSLVSSDVLVRLPPEEVDPLVQWLHGRGVRRIDDE